MDYIIEADKNEKLLGIPSKLIINGKIIKSVKDAKVGQSLEIKVSDGSIDSKVTNIN